MIYNNHNNMLPWTSSISNKSRRKLDIWTS